MDNRFWHLKSCDLFRRLSPEQIARIESSSRFRKFKKRDFVFLPAQSGESVLLLVSGRVKLYHLTPEGNQLVLAYIDPGELFGELAVFNDQKHEEFAEAVENSEVVLIPGAEMMRLMEEQPVVSLGMTELMGLRQHRIERRLKSLLFRSTTERLAHVLLEFAEKYGRSIPAGVLIDTKISHQELANFVGSTRATITILLGELQARRHVLVNRRRFILPDPQRFAAEFDYKLKGLPVNEPSDERVPFRAAAARI